MRYTSLLLTCMLLLAACASSNAAPALPADTNRIVEITPPMTSFATTAIPTLVAPSATSTPPTATPPATMEGQYRTWMEEARIRHPYSETVEQMWDLMLCESSGKPDLVAGPYHGLFQYAQETWQGDWNPYRDRPILDPQAQIFATAKAWHDGYQSWWGCYRG